ncbi:MAG: NAD(P)H-dependent oxidoreductase subunit E [Desulfobacteraceae bacterium]|nr:NAD(P)H-dependent oxidoreductase subunit E [Desulfobacteraceae bacterium]
MKTAEIVRTFEPVNENLIMILHHIQNHNPRNYISAEDMAWVADYLKITQSAVYGVVEYYTMFSTTPRGEFVIRVCKSPVCRMMGTDSLLNHLVSILGIPAGGVTSDELFSLETAECLGLCEKAPAMMINDKVYGSLTPESCEQIITAIRKSSTR